MNVGECHRLLLMVLVQVMRGQVRPRGSTTAEFEPYVALLRAHYARADTPYGDDERGFQRWLLDLWPAPPTA
jgi:hypothetical protein